MLSLFQLGNIITEKLINGYKLIELNDILSSYNSTDWHKYSFIDDTTYYRQVVFINKYIEIVIITWSPQQESKIHDHPENGCLMKILIGNLSEITYDKDLSKINETLLNKDDITYIESNKTLHKIKNNYDISCSLHIYSPPKHKIKFYN